MHAATGRFALALVGSVGLCQALIAGDAPGQEAKKLESGRKPFLEESIVWKHKEDGVWPHHVYGLVQAPDGAILAFAEGRVQWHDHSPHHLVVKRSTDGGRTWSKNIYIEKADGAFWAVNGHPGKMEAWTNTGPVVDEHTARVFFFYALNEGSKHQNSTRVFYRYSDDNGKTWLPSKNDGGRVEVTQLFADNPHGWTFHMPGPGHGIQLRFQQGVNKGKNGRLVLAVWHRRAVTANPRLYGVSLLVSDDHGRTWRHTGDAGVGHGINEGRIIELVDGRILLNARGGAGRRSGAPVNTQKHRVYAYSEDAGESFCEPAVKKDFNYSFNGCDSGMQRYASTPESARNCILFSRPADPKNRAAMTISVSMDEGKSWTRHKTIHEGPSYYSDIVVLPDRTIGLLYGKGGGNRFVPNHVVFARLNYEYLVLENETTP